MVFKATFNNISVDVILQFFIYLFNTFLQQYHTTIALMKRGILTMMTILFTSTYAATNGCEGNHHGDVHYVQPDVIKPSSELQRKVAFFSHNNTELHDMHVVEILLKMSLITNYSLPSTFLSNTANRK